jgi:hypothetical protein
MLLPRLRGNGGCKLFWHVPLPATPRRPVYAVEYTKIAAVWRTYSFYHTLLLFLQTLLNKAALSSFNFKAPDALLFYQCLLCVVLVRLFAAFRLIKVGLPGECKNTTRAPQRAQKHLQKTPLLMFKPKFHLFMLFIHEASFRTTHTYHLSQVEPFNWKIVRVWYPVNIIFVCMIVTSFWALKDLGVPMSTVLKNLTNLIVVSAEYFMYGRVYNKFIWACMGLMVLSGFCGAATDLAFSASGYFWQLVNAIFTASNMLYLK